VTIDIPSLCHLPSLLAGRDNFTYKIRIVSGFKHNNLFIVFLSLGHVAVN